VPFSHVDIVTVVRVWAYSLAVMVVLSVVYFVLNQWKWLNDLGRSKRGKIERRVEDFISELQRVSIVHAKDDNGQEIFKIETQQPPDDRDY
jgi:H+-transporting ATPase